MVTSWPEQWEELLRPGAGWTKGLMEGDSYRKRSGEILGHVEDRFFFVPLFSDVEMSQCEEEDGSRQDTETA